MIRKIFPPKESVFTVDTTGDGKADSVQIKVINLIIPFEIPENIEVGDFKLESFDFDSLDLSEYFKILLDNEPINISKDSVSYDTLKNQFLIYHKGEPFTVEDILKGKLSGRTIALGDSISVLLKLNAETLTNLTEGKHSFKIESDLISNLIINFELDETNMNLKFDSDDISKINSNQIGDIKDAYNGDVLERVDIAINAGGITKDIVENMNDAHPIYHKNVAKEFFVGLMLNMNVTSSSVLGFLAFS